MARALNQFLEKKSSKLLVTGRKMETHNEEPSAEKSPAEPSEESGSKGVAIAIIAIIVLTIIFAILISKGKLF